MAKTYRFKFKKKAQDLKGSVVAPILNFLMKEYGEVDVKDGMSDLLHFTYVVEGETFTIDVYVKFKELEKSKKGDLLSQPPKFTDAEMEFFDLLGYKFSQRYAHWANQNIGDYF